MMQLQQIKLNPMSDINSSLIGYLKKKSLFANSPLKNKELRSQSREQNIFDQSQKSQKKISYNPQHRTAEPQVTFPTKHLNKHSSTQQFANHDFDSQSQKSNPIQSPIRYQRNVFQDQKPKITKRQFNFQPKYEEPTVARQEQPKERMWNIMSKVITFQSARLESAQCLDNMLVKMQTQISSINYKIDAFRSKMCQILDEEFANLREKINYMVEKVIQESENNMKVYIKQQEKLLASDLVAMRQNLIKQYQKIEVMKDDINKPHWRKVAGELLSSELEEKVEQMLMKSKSMNVKPWQLKDLGEEKLPILQKQMKNVFKLGST